MTQFDEQNKEEVRLLSLLYRDGGEPSAVAKELHSIAHAALLQRHREKRQAREAALSDRDSQGYLKKRIQIELQVIHAAAFLLREEETFEDMLIELPLELADRGIGVSRNTLKKIIETRRRDIERMSKGGV